ncbi:glucosamine-6-phosphate deaminase [Thorsellia kenyensis]|uniref:Glucosamine-6-phosphate deaminase n=1 Tax=Thorsellia kenyensis TaxID=1549888 RepID=A0ABV6C8P7_9GAMM
MQLIVEKDYEAMSQSTMTLLLSKMIQPKKVNMAITAGNTPKRTYELLVEQVKNKPHFSNVTYFNFDEIPVFDEQGYGLTMHHLNRLYFKPANISSDQIMQMTPYNYLQFDDMIDKAGGLDLILMGIGADGHFCGNLPNTTEWQDKTVRINATEKHKELLLNEVGGDITKVPDYWVTMGPKSVMHARHLVLFATGKSKANIIKQALEGPITLDVPASILQLHPNLTVVLDEDAASELTKK